MKISIIDHVGSKAGMDYYSDSLAKGLVENGITVSIFSNFIGINNKITYRNIFDNHNNKNSLIKLFKFIFSIIKSSFISKIESTDYVILHLFTTNILTLLLTIIPKLFKLKTIIIAHDISSFANNDNKIIQKFIYNNLSDYIIVHNKFSFDELVKINIIKDKNKIHICKHGGYLDYIDFNKNKQLIRKELNLDLNKNYALFFGQIKDVKGLDILLEAMATVDKETYLIIAGKPWKSDFSSYEKLIEKYNLNDRIIRIIKFISDEDREKLFFASDVNILPYKVIYQSGVLLMAMSHKLPVIASNLLPNMEIIKHQENGLLFLSENAKDLSEKINLFFSDKELQNKLSENSYLTIKNDFNWKLIAQEYINFLNKGIKND